MSSSEGKDEGDEASPSSPPSSAPLPPVPVPLRSQPQALQAEFRPSPIGEALDARTPSISSTNSSKSGRRDGRSFDDEDDEDDEDDDDDKDDEVDDEDVEDFTRGTLLESFVDTDEFLVEGLLYEWTCGPNLKGVGTVGVCVVDVGGSDVDGG